MPFEVFDKRATPEPSEPYVSLQKTGVFALNHAAYDLLGRPKAVELLFDRTDNVIGFRSADALGERAYPVRLNVSGHTHLVSGGAFTRHYGISTDPARRWHAEMRDKVLCVDLGKTGVLNLMPEVAAAVRGDPERFKRKGKPVTT